MAVYRNSKMLQQSILQCFTVYGISRSPGNEVNIQIVMDLFRSTSFSPQKPENPFEVKILSQSRAVASDASRRFFKTRNMEKPKMGPQICHGKK